LTLTLIASVLIVVFNNRLGKAKDSAYVREKQVSDERISTADATAANALKDAGVANEKAGFANERAEKLEASNLALRGQVATLEIAATDAKRDLAEQKGKTADLEKAAADAKTELAKQQERTLKAEKELEETKDRVTSVVQGMLPHWAKFIAHMEVLKSSPQGTIDIVYKRDSANGFRLGFNIGMYLSDAGWTLLSSGRAPDHSARLQPRAVDSVMDLLPELARLNWSDMVVLSREGLNQNPVEKPKTPAVALWRFLASSEVPAYITADPTLPEGVVRLVITAP
jgi:hypothetical protein